jgi:hypothetical protein
LGAMIPASVENLIAANKNIGTTHITNGCFRLHPVEWNIGEAAGLIASYAIEQDKTPKAIREDKTSLRAFQKIVIGEGIPVSWLIDVPVWSTDFMAIQRLVLAGGYGGAEDTLEYNPDEPATDEDQSRWLPDTKETKMSIQRSVSRAEFARAMLKEGQI